MKADAIFSHLLAIHGHHAEGMVAREFNGYFESRLSRQTISHVGPVAVFTTHFQQLNFRRRITGNTLRFLHIRNGQTVRDRIRRPHTLKPFSLGRSLHSTFRIACFTVERARIVDWERILKFAATSSTNVRISCHCLTSPADPHTHEARGRLLV